MPPEIIIAPSNASVIEGNSVFFICSALTVGNSVPPTINWLSVDNEEFQVIDTNTTRINITVFQSTFIEGDVLVVTSFLEVCGVELEDQGDYACRATIPDSSAFDVTYFNITVVLQSGGRCIYHIHASSGMYTHIYVVQNILTDLAELFISTVPPTITIAPSDADAGINSTVLFTCVAYGDPLPVISWFIDSERLYNDTNSSSLIISTETLLINDEYLFVQSILVLCHVTEDDEGLYTCVAENNFNHTQSEFYLNILGKCSLI